MADKYSGFRPHQGGSIDGFLSGAGQQPRRRPFRGAVPTQTATPAGGHPLTLPKTPFAAPSPRPTAPQVPRGPRPLSDVAASTDVLPRPEQSVRPQQSMSAVAAQPSAAQTQSQAMSSTTTASARPLRPAAELKPRAAAKPAKQKQKGGFKRKFKKFMKILGILVLLAALALGGIFYKDIAKLTGNKNPLSLFGAFTPARLNNENGRVNVLVAGNSADDLGHDGAQLTDSIMVLSLDTHNDTALMLSIPRDLYVQIPGFGHAKINEAYPDGGMDLLQKVVENDLGIPIHYQVLVNYSAFRDLVNAVGGITITIDSPDPRGIYDPSLDYTTRNCCALAKYPNGPVTLDGKQALNLARARGDAYGSYGYPGTDFTRTEYQRKMLLAIKDKASSPSVIANPFKVVKLIDAVGNNVRTNLQVDEIETLYSYMKNIPDNKIDSYNINTLKGDNTTMLANYTTPTGQSALIPAAGIDDFTAIAEQIQWVFTATPIQKEAANVVLLNGTNTVGLAREQAVTLKSLGMMVPAQSDAPANQQTTTIIDNSGGKKPATLAELQRRYSATVVTNKDLIANYPGADFIVILGQNVAAQQAKAATSGN